MNQNSVTLMVYYKDSKLSQVTDYLSRRGYKIVEKEYDGGSDLDMKQDLKTYIPALSLFIATGYDAVRYAKIADPQQPILYIGNSQDVSVIKRYYAVGVDEFVSLPVHPEILECKIEAVLKRCPNRLVKGTKMLGRYAFNFRDQTLQCPDIDVHLRPKDAEVLNYLIDNIGTVLEKRRIIQDIWGSCDEFVSRSFDVSVCYLRRYLGYDERIRIKTLSGKKIILSFSENE